MSLALVANNEQVERAEFDDFWLLYPKRVAKKDAAKVWQRMPDAHRLAALTACVAWRGIWATRDVEYMPHPATWLNGERWEDELPSTVGHASHVTAKPEAVTRGEMPAHVRELLARLRK